MEDSEGLSTGKKVVAGAALGVAVPAAVAVGKKLLGDGGSQSEDDQQRSGSRGSQQRSQSRSRAGSSGGARKSSGGSSARKASSGSKARSSASKRTSSSSRSRSSSSSRSGSSRSGTERTKEQLYNQAKRLKIDGRSSMTKAQLERAISRARS
jgi:hypothetical protein